MKLNFYDRNLNRIGEIQTWMSMVWQVRYNTQGVFQLECQKIDGIYRLLKRWNYVCKPDSNDVMVILSVQTKDGIVLAVGAPATCILARRISTEEVSNENAELAMRRVVSNMTPWDNLELGTLAELTDTYTPQFSDGSVLEYLENIGEACDIGFRIIKDGKKLKLVCYKPTLNANARFSEEWGNVGGIEHTDSDVNYYNVARVAGAGDGADRVTVWAGNTALTGADRLELYVDARDIQKKEEETDADYEARLVARGEQKLIDQARIDSVAFDIDNDNVSLGEVVYVRLTDIGVSFQVRVTGIKEVSQNNQTTTTIELGQPIFKRRM